MKFKFPIIRPAFPPPATWLDELETSYAENWFTNFGPVVRKFEESLAHSFGREGETVTSASSCTSGLAAALIAVDARGQVAFPAFTFPATASAILMAGATPLAVDVDEQTWTLSPSLLERALEDKRTTAVVLVVPFGIAQDFGEHLEICRRRGVPVVIDNAAGLGGPTLTLPDETVCEVWSLHATKVFAIGEGGAIRAKASQAGALRRALNFGLEHGEPGGGWGINGKLPDVSAAVGLAMLRNFERALEARRTMVAEYLALLARHGRLRYCHDVRRAPWQTFPILFPHPAERLRFQKAAADRGIEVRRYYWPSLERWPRVARFADCPIAASLAERMACLPVYSEATPSETDALTGLVSAALTDSA